MGSYAETLIVINGLRSDSTKVAQGDRGEERDDFNGLPLVMEGEEVNVFEERNLEKKGIEVLE